VYLLSVSIARSQSHTHTHTHINLVFATHTDIHCSYQIHEKQNTHNQNHRLPVPICNPRKKKKNNEFGLTFFFSSSLCSLFFSYGVNCLPRVCVEYTLSFFFLVTVNLYLTAHLTSSSLSCHTHNKKYMCTHMHSQQQNYE
jgi:hypothetical protein